MKPAVPPSILLERVLSNHDRSAEDLVRETNLSASCVQGILSATLEINDTHARELAGFFDVPSEVWLNAQAIYEDECEPGENTTRPCPNC